MGDFTTLSAYSAHADHTPPPKKNTLVHDEARARKALAKALEVKQ